MLEFDSLTVAQQWSFVGWCDVLSVSVFQEEHIATLQLMRMLGHWCTACGFRNGHGSYARASRNKSYELCPFAGKPGLISSQLYRNGGFSMDLLYKCSFLYNWYSQYEKEHHSDVLTYWQCVVLPKPLRCTVSMNSDRRSVSSCFLDAEAMLLRCLGQCCYSRFLVLIDFRNCVDQ